MKDRFEKALAMELPYPRSVERVGRASAVLALFALEDPSDPSSVALLLTRRTETVESHKGQAAFPGGRMDPEDELERGLETTALRETEEEVGIPREHVRILGQMESLGTLTGYVITPFVGWLEKPFPEVPLKLSSSEIAGATWLRWSELKDPEIYSLEEIAGGAYRTDVFRVRDYRIWGATAAILKNLMDRLQALE